MTKSFIKNAAIYTFSAILSVLFIWYIAYHLLSGLEKGVETTPAVIATKANSVLLDAYIMRDEEIVYANTRGGINYLYDDGEKIGAGATVANIYAGSDAEETANRIFEIDTKLELLESNGAANEFSQTDTNTIDEKINELYYIIRDKIEDGDYEYALYRKNELLTYLNKRLLVTQNLTDHTEQINKLKNERATLAQKLVELEDYVTVDRPGYFYSKVDGYEAIFNTQTISDLTLASFDAMTDSEPADYSGEFPVGKIVRSTDWYLVSETTKDNLKKFTEGNTYEIKFPYNSDVSIKMKLEKIVKEADSDKTVLVFKTDVMPSGFNYLRKQNVQIIEESYTGYKVPSNAVRVINGKKGVYILSGNTVKFKEITVLVEQDGYFIVEERPSYYEDPDCYDKLGLYDMIIVSGKNLYDGKIISASGGK